MSAGDRELQVFGECLRDFDAEHIDNLRNGELIHLRWWLTALCESLTSETPQCFDLSVWTKPRTR